MEKEKLELRVSEEKEKGTKRMQQLQEDLELRGKEEMQDKDEEIECL